jgi:hypothetical protein
MYEVSLVPPPPLWKLQSTNWRSPLPDQGRIFCNIHPPPPPPSTRVFPQCCTVAEFMYVQFRWRLYGHNLERHQTWGFRTHCLYYKPVSSHFCTRRGGGGGPLVEVTEEGIARRKTLKDFGLITFKNLASGYDRMKEVFFSWKFTITRGKLNINYY